MASEKRLIDAHQFRGKHEVAEVNGKLCSVICYADIVNAPTVDAVEVVHGRWIATEEWMTDECSRCGARIDIEAFDECSYHPKNCKVNLDYCPNCGAKMDGDGNV